MEEKEMRRFSLVALLLVTGFCFLAFTLLFRIIDSATNKTFLWIGLIFIVSGSFAEVLSFIYRTIRTKKVLTAR